jgi:hypothetical protein
VNGGVVLVRLFFSVAQCWNLEFSMLGDLEYYSRIRGEELCNTRRNVSVG